MGAGRMVVVLGAALAVASSGGAEGVAPAPAERLWEALDRGLAVQREAVPAWIAAADSAAARFLAGGRLWVGGSFPDFDGEACNRAGGLMAIGPMRDMGRTPADTVGSRDVVLLGLHRPRAEDRLVVPKLRGHGALVIGFGARAAHPGAAAGCHAWLESGAPQVVAGAPAASILAVANLWAFNGELIAACLRRGQMPTIWQSIMMAGSEERNARYLPHRVHEDLLPPPVEAGHIAAAYLDSLELYVRQFRRLEWQGLMRAGERVRAVRRAGGTAHVCPLGGHLRVNQMDLDRQIVLDGEMGLDGTAADLADVSRYVTAEALADTLETGEVIYIQGYTDPPADLIEAAAASGAASILSLAGRGGEPPDRGAADVVLDAQWELGDATVPLDGYDVPLLPPSGFMSAALYWALVLASE